MPSAKDPSEFQFGSTAPGDDVTPAWLYSQGIAGNEERFARRFSPLVHQWAAQEIKKAARLGWVSADDLAQTVLLKVFARFRDNKFTPTVDAGSFHAYLRQCVRHAAIDALRSVGAAHHGVQFGPELWDELAASIDSLADRFDTAWVRTISQLREALARVQKRVGALRWEAFRMTVLEEMKGAEVAARLGLTPSQVYNAKHDITAYLREELAGLKYEL